MAEIVDVLRALQSNDNAVRGAAEQQYELLKKERPGPLVAALLGVVGEPRAELPVREQAAVLLRQCLGRVQAERSIWSRLVFEPSQLEVLARLLQLFEIEQDDKVRRKIADCIQSLGNQLIDIDDSQRPQNAQQWPELLPTLMRIVAAGTMAPSLRADALWIVKELTGSVWQVLSAGAQQTVQVVKACLADPSEAVRASAACLLFEVAGCIDTKEERKPFMPLLEEFFSVVGQLAACQDPQHLKVVLQALGSLSAEGAELYKGGLASCLLSALAPVARAHSDSEARRLALEVLCSVVEAKPKMILKVPNSLGTIMEVCAQFLLELDGDLDAWSGCEDDDEWDEREPQHDFGAEVVDRICRALHRVDCFPDAMGVLQPIIARLFEQTSWQSLVAGLVLLRQFMEFVEEEDTVSQMLQVVKAKLRHSHPRVRHAAWGCVTQLAQDQAELAASEEWARQLLEEVLVGLEDPCIKTVLRCMNAFHHYGENVERETLEPIAPRLMSALGKKLQSTPSQQREAITCIAVIAGQLNEGFAQYYPQLMPVLKQIIMGTMHKAEERSLLGKTFECVSLLAGAVGREVFTADAEAILGAMAKAAREPNVASDDPVQEYVMAAAERICSTLHEAFLPFLPDLLPSVLNNLSLSPKEYDEGAAELEYADDVNLTVVPGENGEAKILIMSSSEIEDVQHAVECVHTFVEKLGNGYLPYVGPTAQALLPTFEFSMGEEVRDMAFETWGQLCHCARDGGQPQLVSELVLEFMKRILPRLEGPDVGDDAESLKTRADGVSACLREAGPGVLSSEQVRHITRLVLKLVEDSIQRRKEASGLDDAEPKDEDTDEEEEDEEEAEEQELRQSACNCASAIMMHHSDVFAVEGLPMYLPLAQNLIPPGRATGDRRLGLYMIASLSEHLGERVVSHWPTFLPQLLQDITCQDAEVRSPACYAASFVARQAAFGPSALETATRLAEVISHTRARRGKKKADKPAQMAADNALSALMEILLHHEASLVGAQAQLWGAWVAGLPCQEDEAEGIRNHGTLVQLVQQQKPEVLGPNGEAAPRLLSMLVDMYQSKMVDDLTSFGISQLLCSAGEARLEQFAKSFTEKQRQKLSRIVRNARRSVAH